MKSIEYGLDILHHGNCSDKTCIIIEHNKNNSLNPFYIMKTEGSYYENKYKKYL